MRKILAALLLASCLFACSPLEPEAPKLQRVTLMYAAAMSGLHSSIAEDINEMCHAGLPTLKSGDVFLVYSHMPTRDAAGWVNTAIETSPVLFRAYTKTDGSVVCDTLVTYPSSDVSSTAEVLHKVLVDVQSLFPAPHYGLIVSSHGKGWVPAGYKESTDYFSYDTPPTLTKEICIEDAQGSGININDFAAALPMKMDFIIMDTCLMGCIETAYELRSKCKLLLFSPTEILSDGMCYTTMATLLTNVYTPDIQLVAQQYYEHYQAQSGYSKSATVTVVDCTRLEPLAEVCRTLIDKYRTAINDTPQEQVQAYFYNSLHWFYDLRDIFVQAGASDQDIAQLDAALAESIVYTAATDHFFDLKLKRVCGLSMYKPMANLVELNNFYKTLAWNQATSLVQ